MQKILENIKQQNPTLVNEAILIAEEVNRVAVLLYESWYLSIEEAWRLYSEERKIEKVLALLQIQHDLMRNVPESLSETQFHQQFGSEL